MQRPSDSEERQLILCFDILYMILVDYVEKDKDILNFILANKLYYGQFHDALLLHHVLHGGCTALLKAAKGADMAMIGKMLEIPAVGAAVPRTIWLKMADIAIDLKHVDLMRSILQVNCVRASIDKEARHIAIKGKKAWKTRSFQFSWLQTMRHAIESDQADLVELYLSHGMTLELCDLDGFTAIHMAARAQEKEHLVRLLLEKYGADPNKIPEPAPGVYWHALDTPLTLAAKAGSAKVVKLLLEHKADPCFGGDEKFCRALGIAASCGHKDVVKVLLQDERIEPNARDIGGMTAMGYAVSGGRVDIVQMLLEDERIDPNVTYTDGRSPLVIAASGVCCGEFGQRGPVITKLLLSDKRVDVFLKDRNGRTALHWAANSFAPEIVKILLDGGKLDPNEPDNSLLTPFSLARDAETIRLLINDTRVDPNMRDDEGKTLLMRSVSSRREANVGPLLDSARVDVNLVDNEGNTAMMMACSTRSVYHDETSNGRCIVQCMIDSGRVNLNMVNAKGETALMVAVKSKAVGAVQMILATGHCMVNIRGIDGATMIESAIRAGSGLIVEMLLDTDEVRVEQRAIESAQSQEMRDMLMRYRHDGVKSLV